MKKFENQEVITHIKMLARTRRDKSKPGPYKIATELNSEKLLSPSGKAWNGLTVKRLLDRLNGQEPDVKPRQVKKTAIAGNEFLLPEEIRKCAEQTERQKEQMILKVFCAAGLRAGEMVALQVRDLVLDNGKSEIVVRRGKGHKQRIVTIGNQLADELRNWVKHLPRKAHVFAKDGGDPMSYWQFWRLAKKFGKKVGAEWLSPHKFRHSFSTNLMCSSGNDVFLQRQLGHASLSTTQIYVKTLQQRNLGIMDKFEADMFGHTAAVGAQENTNKLAISGQNLGMTRI